MNNILRSSEKLLDEFIAIRKADPTFIFAPRKINNSNRLDQGYWFLGNEGYLNVSLWNGVDWKERVHIIGLSINEKNHAYIELSGQGNHNAVKFLTKLAEKIPGLTQSKNKYKWFKGLSGKDVSDHVNYFVHTFKPIVDDLLAKEKLDDIRPLNEAYYKKYNKKIIDRRKARDNFGKSNKMARLVWNTNEWKFPSGHVGKSESKGNFDAGSGYGHEEWLFDRSKPLNGYHYGFIQALNLDTDIHVGKSLNISLYTKTNNIRYYVGTVRNAKPINIDECLWAFNEYRKNGWLKQMEQDLNFAGADVEDFKKTPAEIFFNVKFRFDDLSRPAELVRISIDDPNVSNNRFNLLSMKTNVIVEESEGVEEDEGADKSTKKVKRSVHYNSEFSPYHNELQNAIRKYLKCTKQYKKVDLEIGRIDLRALTKTNEWHYFEVKTDSPKMCVRKALGQIMEYAHYPNYQKAKKLIIVGDDYPDSDLISYLNLLREQYTLPISYRCYSFESATLSDDY
jgi:hypothetical protein